MVGSATVGREDINAGQNDAGGREMVGRLTTSARGKRGMPHPSEPPHGVVSLSGRRAT